MVEMGSQRNLPMGVIVNRTIVSPKRSKQMPVILMNTNGYNIWIRQPLLAADLVEVEHYLGIIYHQCPERVMRSQYLSIPFLPRGTGGHTVFSYQQ